MDTRGRGLKVTAVSAMVVLVLTGFSSGHGHKSSGHHSDDGGGCSSSRQDHDGSSAAHGGSPGSHSYQPGPTHPSTPTAAPSHTTAPPLKDGTAVLVRCASVADPYATVEVRNPNGRVGVFTVKTRFKNEQGYTMADTGNQVQIPANDKTTLRIPAIGTGRVDEIAHCDVDPRAVADW